MNHDTWVICLCAQWCGLCRSYQAVFNASAAAHPGTRFEWVDVEDQADALGDLDVQTFPTLLIVSGGQARFLGPIAPQPAVLARLLARFIPQPSPNQPDNPPPPLADAQAQAVFDSLRRLRKQG